MIRSSESHAKYSDEIFEALTLIYEAKLKYGSDVERFFVSTVGPQVIRYFAVLFNCGIIWYEIGTISSFAVRKYEAF